MREPRYHKTFLSNKPNTGFRIVKGRKMKLVTIPIKKRIIHGQFLKSKIGS